MAIRVGNVSLGLDEPEDVLIDRVAERLKVPRDAIRQYAPVRRALDARRGRELRLVYRVELSLADGPAAEAACVRRLHGRHAEIITPRRIEPLEPGAQLMKHRPVIVGFGPAGMFAALLLAQAGYQPIVLERGRDVRRRHKDIMQTFYREGTFNAESNLLFGEGGAGTYSDGKVYTRLSDPEVHDVLATLVRFGGQPEILIDSKPHIGSNRIPTICKNIREHIERIGGEIRFDARVDDFEINDGAITALRLGENRMPVETVLLGIGHSAGDTFARLHAVGVRLEARPFQFGVRIEHPQAMVNRWQYGAAAEHPRLPPADYRLVAKGAAGGAGDLYSFCMCPGGIILPTSELPGHVATNGGSNSGRRGRFANSGFVVTIDPARWGGDPLAGIAFQREVEARAFAATGGTYRVPAQRCSDFLAQRRSDGSLETSHPIGGSWQAIEEILPHEVCDALRRGLPMLDKKMPGFAGGDGIITGPESRASSPVRIPRDRESRQSVSTQNLYPIGEGAGYAGGIVSAAIDGIRSAEAVIRAYRPAE
jgi:hypothetical protein